MRSVRKDRSLWGYYNHKEIVTVIQMYYKTLGYEFYELKEENIDILYVDENNKSNSVLIKKSPSLSQREINSFDNYPNSNKILIYLGTETRKTRELKKKLPRSISFWNKEKLNSEIKKNSPLFWMDINLSCNPFIFELLSLENKLGNLWGEEDQKENPDYQPDEIDKKYFKKLWRLKDDTSYLHKNLKFLVSLFEKEGSESDYVDKHIDLSLYSLNELSYSISTVNSELTTLLKSYPDFCRFVVQETIGRSNWFTLRRNPELFISSQVKSEYDLENTLELEKWIKNISEIKREPRQNRINDSLANVFRTLVNTLWAIESYIDDLFKYSNNRFSLNEQNSFELNSHYNYKKFKVEDLVNDRENRNLEFKASIAWNLHCEDYTPKPLKKAILKTIVAFLNTEGGVLLIGVKDDNSVFGLKKDLKKYDNIDKYEQHLWNLIRDKIGSVHEENIKINFKNLKGKKVCRIDVDPSKTPVYLEWDDKELFYIRGGNRTEKLKLSEIKQYIDEHWD